MATQVYVCEPPVITPTGRFLGIVGFQRLLRRAPATKVGDCVQSSVFVRPDLPERELAARLAAMKRCWVWRERRFGRARCQAEEASPQAASGGQGFDVLDRGRANGG